MSVGARIRRAVICSMGSFLGWSTVMLLGMTARFKVEGYETVREFSESGRGLILAVWHGLTLLPLYYCRGTRTWAITSLSRDGEIQTRLVQRLGYRTIRGSSRRGGVRAALEASKKVRDGGTLSITPDGPMGPALQVQDGIVFLSTRSGCPIVPVGVAARPAMRMRSWDSYLFPAPFSRAALVFGEPFHPEAGEVGAETVRIALERVQARAVQMLAGEER